MNTVLAYLKRPSTYIIALVGALIVLAVPALRNRLAPIAAKIPGAK